MSLGQRKEAIGYRILRATRGKSPAVTFTGLRATKIYSWGGNRCVFEACACGVSVVVPAAIARIAASAKNILLIVQSP